ncbi:MAG: aminotransferase class I/II-fold pyridoxal phosphate-dependent enzyme [Chloroflexi bacterium]|nr:aminotransferase class I/II-fold pyridoxal phosphate-dependent enzyme [Chloroflexota bacterium]MCI0581022.1 aminotransferase class I/II-fold pyridoxal phosphate-dependent enzyme [Chloroflexota bacterium]MCI0646361.1 aminotransferase class I/II-fold pyridoxal phosphate-dependent enzyme [Chloroflexota bacterium]MCI0728381.1 aminotransferase class I/II-fold pyridoxal phosphate-dependent enzyme [Chloroflexota bacterium]
MSKDKQPSWGQQTAAIHAGDAANPSTAVVSPIYQSATFRFEEPADIATAMVATAHPQFYGRYATPNTKQVEATVARLEGGEAALAAASGMAAISLALLSHLQAGDHVVAQTTLYPTTYNLIAHKLPTLGIESTLVEQTDLAAFAAAIRPNTRLVYVESPANPVLSLTDLAAVAQLAQTHHLVAIADNTFATPYNQRPLSLGFDVVVHSATKYLAGHSDVVAGVVVSSAARVEQMWRNHVMLGAVLHPFEAWLVERGLKTFGLRLARHNANAQAVAEFLQGHPAVRRVYYPGLPGHPQHELARQQMPGGFGGMVSFDLRGGRAAGYHLLKHLKLICQAVSLGGVHSLITHPASTISAVQTDEEIAASGVLPGLVRLSVGLEEAADLVADLAQALEELELE